MKQIPRTHRLIPLLTRGAIPGVFDNPASTLGVKGIHFMSGAPLHYTTGVPAWFVALGDAGFPDAYLASGKSWYFVNGDRFNWVDP